MNKKVIVYGLGWEFMLLRESLLCLGATLGDTLFYFLDKYNQFQHAFCFEPECGGRLRKTCRYSPPIWLVKCMWKNIIWQNIQPIIQCGFMIVFMDIISDISADYHFYLRKYGARLEINRNEIVLYAVSEERMTTQ